VTNEASSIPAEKSSSVSPTSTPTASAGNTPSVSVSADKSIPADRSISASRDTNSAYRHPSKLSSNAVSERFPLASNTQNSDI
nr:hypothetical protein [Tanacetum cinerariifolium]